MTRHCGWVLASLLATPAALAQTGEPGALQELPPPFLNKNLDMGASAQEMLQQGSGKEDCQAIKRQIDDLKPYQLQRRDVLWQRYQSECVGGGVPESVLIPP